jgi:transcriptional regulator with XRE-family HTH domain
MKIKNIRMSKNMTQKNIADELNVERTTVAMWENGSALPRADKLPQLAKILDCTIDELFENG